MDFLYDKKKDKRFFRKVYNTIASYGGVRQDIELKEKYYEFFSGNIEPFRRELEQLCNDPITIEQANQLMLSYNKILNKYMVLEGELFRRGFNFKVNLVASESIREKDEEFRAKVMQEVEKDLALIISQAQQTLQSMTPQQVEEFLVNNRKKLTPASLDRRTYASEFLRYKNKMLRFISSDQDIEIKRRKTFRDTFIFGEFYLKNDWKDGKPYIRVLNPLNITYKLDDNYFDVSKADWVKYRDTLTVGEFLDEYINVLSHKEIKECIMTISSSTNLSRDHLEKFVYDRKFSNFLKNNSKTRAFTYYNYDNEDLDSGIFNNTLIREHIEFKAYDPVIFVTHNDEYGDEITHVVDDPMFIPSNATKIEYKNEYFVDDYYYTWEQDGIHYKAEILYIPQRYEMTVINGTKIILERKCPMQPVYTEDPYTAFSLSYKGGAINNIGSKNFSLMDNAIPLQLQYLAIKALFDRELSKYKGLRVAKDIAQIPDELASTPDGESTTEDVLTKAEVIAEKTGNEYFDSENTSMGIVPATRSSPIIPLQLGNAQELINLHQLAQLIDQELGLACLVPASREGQIVNNTNVTDNERSVFQTTLATESIYAMHDYLWSKCLEETLHQWDMYFLKQFEMNPDSSDFVYEYVTPDKTIDVIRVTPQFIRPDHISIVSANKFSDVQYMQYILQKVMQNTQDLDVVTYSEIIKQVTSGMPSEEIHNKLLELQQMQQDKARERAMQEQRMQAQLLEEQKKFEMWKAELEKEKFLFEETERRKTRIMEAEIDSQIYKLANDTNQDEVPDAVEVEKIRQKHEDKRFKQKLEVEKAKIRASTNKSTDNSK